MKKLCTKLFYYYCPQQGSVSFPQIFWPMDEQPVQQHDMFTLFGSLDKVPCESPLKYRIRFKVKSLDTYSDTFAISVAYLYAKYNNSGGFKKKTIVTILIHQPLWLVD